MAYINNTLIKKVLAEQAGNKKTSYRKYRDLADKALSQGHATAAIIAELEREQKRIQADSRHNDDPIFKSGLVNAKTSCLNAIALVITELKGETQ